jgi:DNA-binding NtrC family response regulator
MCAVYPMPDSEKQIDILILDDDRDLLTSIAELLTDCGYKVKGFTDPESALEYALSHRFLVGVFDYRLGPGKDGLDVVEVMRRLGIKSAFVMVTADVEQATRLRALSLKLFDYLRKPVQPDLLLETVELAMLHARKRAA